LNKKNTKHYLEEIFEICGFKYNGEKYILSSFDEFGENWDIDTSKKIIGFNTGCGGRWSSRLWKTENWIELAKKLIANNYEVILLGGEQEDIKNKEIAKLSGAKYFGYYALPTFINLVNRLSCYYFVSMAMHITLALNKKLYI